MLTAKYLNLCNNRSDINEHLPTLKEYAQQCTSAFETGVRGVVSSYALLYGLVKNTTTNNKRIFLNDIEKCDIDEFLKISEHNSISVKYEWRNNLELDFLEGESYDLTFIDTWHIYGQLKRELAKFSKITNKYIIMHDTTVDGIKGESIRQGYNAYELSRISKIPVEEIQCGLQKAIDEFLLNNTEWTLDLKYINNNGLTILKRI